MKKKFEDNAAHEIPKTKANEPDLPWKVSDTDLEEIKSPEKAIDAQIASTPPLKTRASFLVALVLAVFGIGMYMFATTFMENEKKGKELVTIQTSYDKVKIEKNYLDENFSQLEKRVADLSAQKDLYTNVIESLTKPSGEIDNRL